MKRTWLIIITLVSVISLIFPLAACSYPGESLELSMLLAWLADYKKNQQDGSDGDGDSGPGPLIRLTYPAGRSPNVFTTGWLFGASCTYEGKDYSDQLKWSGSGSFSPAAGTRSRPSFSSTGGNTITLSETISGKDYSKNFQLNAVSPAGYACVGMLAQCPAEAHGDPSSPKTVVGPITTGSSQVLVNGRPAARQGDRGVHAACTGPNTFEITGGDSSVLINGRPAAKIGSVTHHCGGVGQIIGGG
jgi:uncharacterized Zn-binding protein involved in type VI secretion